MKNVAYFIGLACFVIIFGAYLSKSHRNIPYNLENVVAKAEEIAHKKKEAEVKSEPVFVASHIKTPEIVKAIYLTSWVAGTKRLRDPLVKLVENTELNAVVIDIKDYTGKIAFAVENPELVKYNSSEDRITDIREFIEELHKKNIYVIGRISVFQDSHMVTIRPDLAVKTGDGSKVWRDRKGVAWIDAHSEEMWKYIRDLAVESHNIGFDEINFDYIRFPSDGDMKDISYPFSENKVKSLVLKEFFEYLRKEFPTTTISADLFGMTTTNKDDLGIGQILEYALENFDFVAPMVYPSHYPPNFNGHANPNAVPYEIIQYSMQGAIDRVKIFDANIASTSIQKLRPWLQDFSYGQPVYGAKEVRAQIQASYDVGLNSWMLWNASNRYTQEALLPN